MPVGNVLALEDIFSDGKTYPWNPSAEEARMVFDQTDGSTILCEWDGSGEGEGASLFWFDRETGGRRLISSLRGEYCSDSGFVVVYCRSNWWAV